MVFARRLLFILLATSCSSPFVACYEYAATPRLENLTETEIRYAKLYWKYSAGERVVHGNRPVGKGPQSHLGYRFIVPLPERLAGITYVGHAARLRLVLERAHNGEGILVGALGGSITFGQAVGGGRGSYVTAFMDWFNAALPPPPQGPAARQGGAEPSATAPASAADRGARLEADGSGIAGGLLRGGGERLGEEDIGGAGGVVAAAEAAGQARASAAGERPAGVRATPETTAAKADGAGGGDGGSKRRVLEATGTAAPDSPSREGAEGAAAAAVAAEAAAAADAGRGASGPVAPPAGGSRVRGGLRAHHDFFNGAVPGTQSAYMSSCMHHHLPPGVDLVLVEYATNDSPAPRWTFADPCRRAMERLIRKLLNLPSRPAVVLVNMYAIEAAHGKYLHTAERDFSEFATYYGLPSVSLKAAVMPSAAVGGAEEVSYGAIFNGGHNHPGRGGHVVVTELLITMCRDLLRSNDNSCDPWVAGSADGADADVAAAVAAVMGAVAERPLPPPLAEDNFESSDSTCYIEHELQSLVLQPLEGWEWTDEGRGKWGYVAVRPDQTLRIRVNTRLVGNRSEEQAAAKIIVQIAYLQSYHGMGAARLSCLSGCACKAVSIDAYDRRPVSVTSMENIQVTQHPDCVLALTTMGPSQAASDAARDNANNSSSNSSSIGGDGGGDKSGGGGGGGDAVWNKFKLLGVVVGEEPGASEGGVTWVRDASHEMAHTMRDMGQRPKRRRRRRRG